MSGHLTEPGGQSQDSARVNRGTLTELRSPPEDHKPDDEEPVQMTLPDTLPGARQVNIYDALEQTAA